VRLSLKHSSSVEVASDQDDAKKELKKKRKMEGYSTRIGSGCGCNRCLHKSLGVIAFIIDITIRVVACSLCRLELHFTLSRNIVSLHRDVFGESSPYRVMAGILQ
jgi:hypothetical protein